MDERPEEAGEEGGDSEVSTASLVVAWLLLTVPAATLMTSANSLGVAWDLTLVGIGYVMYAAGSAILLREAARGRDTKRKKET